MVSSTEEKLALLFSIVVRKINEIKNRNKQVNEMKGTYIHTCIHTSTIFCLERDCCSLDLRAA